MTRCPHCNGRRKAGLSRVHDTGECLQPWRQRQRAKHPRAPGQRLSDEQKRERRRKREEAEARDLPPELIERIMQRRALEQRYERAMSQ